jgi:hypothetical protein
MAHACSNRRADAVKFADGSDVLFSVDCELDASPGSANDSNCSLLVLRVADGGRGMTAAECELAFEPYFRCACSVGLSDSLPGQLVWQGQHGTLTDRAAFA